MSVSQMASPYMVVPLSLPKEHLAEAFSDRMKMTSAPGMVEFPYRQIEVRVCVYVCVS